MNGRNWLGVCATALFSTVPLWADHAGYPASEPRVLLKMVQALEDSGIDGLHSRAAGEDGMSYHLRDFQYLGTIRKGQEQFLLGYALFVRSSPPGSETPPARGHGVLVLFDPGFKIVSHARGEGGELFLRGNVLMEGEEKLLDFGDTGPGTRFHGFPWGGSFLAYPFADRITEEQWNSPTFKP
jgi:hypothetical protein